MSEAKKDVLERAVDFACLRLPGQPIGMHMGTSYLVHDLAAEVRKLRAKNADLYALAKVDGHESLSVDLSNPIGGQREPCAPGTVGGFGAQAATAEVADSAERRSPDGHHSPPSPDESTRQ